jgi:hypothetical protein
MSCERLSLFRNNEVAAKCEITTQKSIQVRLSNYLGLSNRRFSSIDWLLRSVTLRAIHVRGWLRV